jgi:hypothetical protein
MLTKVSHYTGAVTCHWAKDVTDCDWAGTGGEAAKLLTLTAMGWGDLLTLFTIIIALSAYLATIRLARIERAKTPIGDSVDAKKKYKVSMEWGILFITIPDILLVVSAILLAIYMFGSVFYLPRSHGQLSWSVRLFCAAIVILAVYHMRSWLRTADIVFFGWTTGKTIEERLKEW